MKDIIVIVLLVGSLLFVINKFYFDTDIIGTERVKAIRQIEKENEVRNNERIKVMVNYVLKCEECIKDKDFKKLKKVSEDAALYIVNISISINNEEVTEINNEAYNLFVMFQKLALDNKNDKIKKDILIKINEIDKLIDKYNWWE